MPPRGTPGPVSGPERRRLAAYTREIEPLLAPWRGRSGGSIGLVLAVGVPAGEDPLVGYALDRLVEPLASALASSRLDHVAATKARSPVSTLRLGPVTPANGPLAGGNQAQARCRVLSPAGRRDLNRQIAARATGQPWGPIEIDLALRVGARRDWITTWRPAVEALGSILGRRPGGAALEDGRIVALHLHRTVDPALGAAVELDVRWRLLERHPDGPALRYDAPLRGGIEAGIVL